jgi:hypothetical protein
VDEWTNDLCLFIGKVESKQASMEGCPVEENRNNMDAKYKI